MRPDLSGLATFTCPYVLIKRVELLTEKRTLKASFFFRKQHESESLADLIAVVTLANQIIWKILTRIVIGLF